MKIAEPIQGISHRAQLRDACITYLRGGLSIIPVKQDKTPLIAWKRYQHKAMDEATLQRYLNDEAVTGLAAVCGAVSGKLLIFDFDIPRFYEAWRQLVGHLADGLPLQRTGNGFQLALRCDEPKRNLPLAWAPNTLMREGREIAIETRGEGGYALLPPSLHPNGNYYVTLAGDFTAIPYVDKATVDILLEAARALDEAPLTQQEMLKRSIQSDSWKANLNGQGSIIEAFNDAYSIREILERNGYERDGSHRYRRPGGKSASVAILDDQCSYHWSTNDPLCDNHRHDAFSVYSILEYAGDVKAAVKSAAELLGIAKPVYRLADAELEEELPIIPLPSDASAPFPVEVFPTPLRRFVEEGARSIFCPSDFLAVPLLALAGAAIGTSRVLQIKPGWREGPRMYAAIVADPGSKKSPALDVVLSPFRKQQHMKLVAYQQELERHQKEQAMSDSFMHEPKELHMEQVITTDSTLEALTEVLEQNPRGLLFFRDELTGWVLSMNQYKGGRGADRQAWLSFWNGAQVIVNRKSRKAPLILDNPFVSVVGAIPPEMLTELPDERGREDGFIHRILFAYPKQMDPKWTEESLAPDVVEKAEAVFDCLWSLRTERNDAGHLIPVLVDFTVEGKRKWVEWITQHYNEFSDADFHDNLRGPWSKMEGYCARLALILQECRVASGEVSSECVDEVSVAGAATLIDYFKAQARRVYAQLKVTPEDKRIMAALKWIKRNGGQVTLRDITRSGVAGVKTSEETKQLVFQLQQRGYGIVEEKVPQHGGRTSHHLTH